MNTTTPKKRKAKRLNTKRPRATKPNAGIRVWYVRQIVRLIEALRKSVLYWVGAKYKSTRTISSLMKLIDELRDRWTVVFNDSGERIAGSFVNRVDSVTTNSMKSAIAEVGFNVDWSNQPAVKNVLETIRQTQVDLIKTIPQNQLDRVAGIISRGIQNGRDLQYIHEEIAKGFDISAKRANVIATDQTNKATFAIQRARHLAIGVKQGEWIHIAGKKTSRKTHVQMNRKLFDLDGKDAGMYDPAVGKRVFPAELINCACTYIPIIPPVFQLKGDKK